SHKKRSQGIPTGRPGANYLAAMRETDFLNNIPQPLCAGQGLSQRENIEGEGFMGGRFSCDYS
ncbi:MAG: hypothetical protein II443_07565, partial [Oscillospiraceae bacterium]|nr:hypothetical protein [Oscillospiraceae bacterium]